MLFGSHGYAWKCSVPPRTASMPSPTRPGPTVPVTRPTFPTTSSVMVLRLSAARRPSVPGGIRVVTPRRGGNPRGSSGSGHSDARGGAVAVDADRLRTRNRGLRDHLELDDFHAGRRERDGRAERRALPVGAERRDPALGQTARGERDRLAGRPCHDQPVLV